MSISDCALDIISDVENYFPERKEELIKRINWNLALLSIESMLDPSIEDEANKILEGYLN